MANGVPVNQLIGAGLVRAPQFPGSFIGSYGGRLAGLNGGLGKVTVMGAPQGEIAANQRAYETAYQGLVTLVQQIQAANQEVRAAAGNLDDPSIASIVDDAALIAADAQDRLAEARTIYELEEGWVKAAVAANVHGDWGYGRDVVIGGRVDAPGNRSGRALDPWNRNQILSAAARAMGEIQRGLAQSLGQLRQAREQVLTKAKAVRLASERAAVEEARQAAAQAQQDKLAAIRQQIEEDKVRREQEAYERQARLEEERAIREQQLAQQRAEAEIAAEERRRQLQESLEQSRINAEQQRLNAQLQQEQRAAELEQSRINAELQRQQQQAAFDLQIAQQTALAKAQAEMAAMMPPPPPLYGAGALSVPGYGMPQGAIPAPMVPPPFPGYQEAAYAGASAAFPQSFSPIGPQALPNVNMPAPVGWSPQSGELFGMGATPGVLDQVGSFFNQIAPGVTSVIGAATGRTPPMTQAAPAPRASGVSGSDLLLLGGAAAAGYWLWKRSKKKGGGRRRRR